MVGVMRLPRFLLNRLIPHALPFASAYGGAIRDVVDDASQIPMTEAQAMRVPAYYACVRVLSNSIAQMPLRLRQKKDDGVVDVMQHPAIDVLRDPIPNRPVLTGQALIKAVVQSIVIHGNGYLEQVRVNGGSKLFSLKPIDPCRVELCVNDAGDVIYKISPPTIGGKMTGNRRELMAPDILHFRGTYTDAEGYLGIGTLVTLRDLLRASVEMQYHAKRSLIGGNMKGFLIYPSANITAEQRQQAEVSLNDPNADQKWKVMPGAPSVTYAPSSSNQASQFVESRRAQVAEFARAFGIPNYLLMDVISSSNWGSGLVEQSASFVRYTLQPMTQSVETVLDQNILTAEERAAGMFFEFDFRSFLRGTPNQRADYYAKGIASGWMSPPEARAMEGMMPDEGCCNEFKPVAQVAMPTGAPPAGHREPNQPNTDPEE